MARVRTQGEVIDARRKKYGSNCLQKTAHNQATVPMSRKGRKLNKWSESLGFLGNSSAC
jgi:hypothetical protein